jgi:hypothetical protein
MARERATIGRKLVRVAIRHRMWAVAAVSSLGLVAAGAVASADHMPSGVVLVSETTTTTTATDSAPIRIDFTQRAPDYQALNKHTLFTVGSLTVRVSCSDPAEDYPANLAIWFHDNLAATLADWEIRGADFVGPGGAIETTFDENIPAGSDRASDGLGTDTQVPITQGGFVFRDASQVVTGQLAMRISGPKGPCTVQGLAFASRHAAPVPAGRASHEFR